MTNIDQNRWDAWTAIPASASLGTPSVVSTPHSLYVFYTNPTTNQIQGSRYRVDAPSGWEVTNQEVPGGGRSNNSPTVATYGIGTTRMALFHVGNDLHVYRQNFNLDTGAWGGRWTDSGGTVRAHSRVAAAATGALNDTIEVAVRGQDDYPWIMTYTNNDVTFSWHPAFGARLTTHAPYLYAAATQFAVFLAVTIGNTMFTKRAT
jgi:hypothetical protein